MLPDTSVFKRLGNKGDGLEPTKARCSGPKTSKHLRSPDKHFLTDLKSVKLLRANIGYTASAARCCACVAH